MPSGINIRDWVDEAKADPVKYRSRQAAEILLTAIGLTKSLKDCLFLKGGTLMALGFRSTRVTADIDFTTDAEPDDLPKRIENELNDGLRRSQAKLGYLDILCRVQKVKMRPRPENFSELTCPALEVSIGYVKKGSKGEKRFHEGMATDTVKVEISFKEQVSAFQELHLSGPEVAIKAYSETEIIAEKLRALLQQPILRGKSRRQDIYDISLLIQGREYDQDELVEIHSTFLKKCHSRDIFPDSKSFDDPIIKELAYKDWHTLLDELDDLPDFEKQFDMVSGFYRNLPWTK